MASDFDKEFRTDGRFFEVLLFPLFTCVLYLMLGQAKHGHELNMGLVLSGLSQREIEFHFSWTIRHLYITLAMLQMKVTETAQYIQKYTRVLLWRIHMKMFLTKHPVSSVTCLYKITFVSLDIVMVCRTISLQFDCGHASCYSCSLKVSKKNKKSLL